MSRKTENEAWHAGFTACANEHTRQRREPEYPITRTVPERYRWTQDYNETLISAAGGDGDNADIVTIRVKKHHADVEAVAFTNVPMHHVHAAIALLNGDGETPPPGFTDEFMRRVLDAVPNAEKYRKFYPPYVAEGTREFTSLELFGDQAGVLESTSEYECGECGAIIYNRVKHVTWHNKTLP